VPRKDLEYSGLDGAFLTHLSAPTVRVGLWIQWLASAAYPKPPGLARIKSRFSKIFQKLMVYGRTLV